MVTYRVIVLPRAFSDLDAILDYIGKHSPQNAAAMVDRLLQSMQGLTALPHRYKVHERRKDRPTRCGPCRSRRTSCTTASMTRRGRFESSPSATAAAGNRGGSHRRGPEVAPRRLAVRGVSFLKEPLGVGSNCQLSTGRYEMALQFRKRI